jgi:hypothetical protein
VPELPAVIRPADWDALRERVRSATPFPHLCLDDFLEPAFAEQCADALPSFEEAARVGRGFLGVNQRRKVQVSDSGRFPEPIRRLHEALASPGWLRRLEHVMSIPGLLADPELVGGGIHETGPSGRLDVHVDFNLIEERGLHRRLNILVYLNREWRPEWGGSLELWDRDVRTCRHSFLPVLNRCVVFETTDVSFHGVSAVTCPAGHARKSFAAYYYTREAPPHWTGESHSTIFRARPHERLKGRVLMPMEAAGWRLAAAGSRVKRALVGPRRRGRP